MEDTKKDVEGLASGCLGLILLPLMYPLEGWALSVLWKWFIVTTFHAAPLSVAEAVGLICVCNYLKASPGVKRETYELLQQEGLEVMCVAISLGIGLIVKTWFL